MDAADYANLEAHLRRKLAVPPEVTTSPIVVAHTAPVNPGCSAVLVVYATGTPDDEYAVETLGYCPVAERHYFDKPPQNDFTSFDGDPANTYALLSEATQHFIALLQSHNDIDRDNGY